MKDEYITVTSLNQITII